MSMNGPGMWMPKQKDGKNWEVSYSGLYEGKPFATSRKFRVKANALDFIKASKKTFALDDRVSNIVFEKPVPIERVYL